MKRAMSGDGTVEFLGGFDKIPPGELPGWIIRVTSEHNRVWLMGVVPDKVRPTFTLVQLTKIPWEHWTDPTGDPLYDGDKPHEYAQLRRYTSGVSTTENPGDHSIA